MKYKQYINTFENEYDTTLVQTPQGLQWTIKGVSNTIGTQALGLYKRKNINFYEVLVLISFNKQFNGTLRTAIHLTNILPTTIVDKNGKYWQSRTYNVWRTYDYDDKGYKEITITEKISYSMARDEINMRVGEEE